MSHCTVLALYLVGFAVFTNAMPQQNDEDRGWPAWLPSIGISDGKIKASFGGYHAEAGLGGILGDNTGGGLSASAGTPWGANAAAGLGGLLSGSDASAGGNLYARAGLGEGRPSAGAGLGGMVSGDGRSVPVAGGLYAGATTGQRDAAKVDANAQSSAEASTSEGSSRPLHSRIQIVSRKEPKANQLALEAAGKENESKVGQGAEVRREAQYGYPGATFGAGLYGAIGLTGGSTVTKTVDKVKVSNGGVKVVENPVIVPAAPPEVYVSEVHRRPVHPRRNFRKRVWATKQYVIQGPPPQPEVVVIPPKVPVAASNVVVSQAAADSHVNADSSINVYKNIRTRTLFDDIFNIPISTLAAVNQLLNNKVG
ncbi:hypothetical protein KM043_005783 [Ampulex compressa]|nr:hypothetical protein KM043_005783 [Ampulex compressa]